MFCSKFFPHYKIIFLLNHITENYPQKPKIKKAKNNYQVKK